MNYECIPVKCDYIKANEGYDKLINSYSSIIKDDDIIIISETPISTAEGNLKDEKDYNYGVISYLIAEIWCKILWGHVFGGLLKINPRTIENLKKMPKESRNHKELILREYGLKYALQPTGEAGVDLSNVPEDYVSLLPENPEKSAKRIQKLIKNKYNKKVDVIIIDTDPTYKFKNKLFTTLPKSIAGITNGTGVYGYILRSFSKKVGCTPLTSTLELNAEEIIRLGNLAEKSQKDNSKDFFETVYNMSDKFKVDINKIDEKMLKSITHIPSVLIRKKYL